MSFDETLLKFHSTKRKEEETKEQTAVRIIEALLIKTIKETSFCAATFERRARNEATEKWTESQRGRERELWREGGSTAGKDGVKMEGEKYEWDGVTGIPTLSRRHSFSRRSSGNTRQGFQISYPRGAWQLFKTFSISRGTDTGSFSRMIYKWKSP